MPEKKTHPVLQFGSERRLIGVPIRGAYVGEYRAAFEAALAPIG